MVDIVDEDAVDVGAGVVDGELFLEAWFVEQINYHIIVHGGHS